MQFVGQRYNQLGRLPVQRRVNHARRGEWAAVRALNEQAARIAGSEIVEFTRPSRVLAAKLDFAEGNRESGCRQRAALLAETENETEQASLYYELWRLTGDVNHAQTAVEGYPQAWQQAPSSINQRRLEELQRFLSERKTVGR
jgi:hypothetical protein